ncbi:hypothetical protein GGX14DRAFT_593902 [Mycena pura]|uniref:Uncharacterized protein n=1 Tax=Mycena pura TaxID=153505 RepID=A0AAD6XZZ9_9AGAR|nr:hypothetical protein GGX14DRAFT_593902 [Mycena pura]
MSDVNYDFYIHVLMMLYAERVEKRITSNHIGLSEEFWVQATAETIGIQQKPLDSNEVEHLGSIGIQCKWVAVDRGLQPPKHIGIHWKPMDLIRLNDFNLALPCDTKISEPAPRSGPPRQAAAPRSGPPRRAAAPRSGPPRRAARGVRGGLPRDPGPQNDGKITQKRNKKPPWRAERLHAVGPRGERRGVCGTRIIDTPTSLVYTPRRDGFARRPPVETTAVPGDGTVVRDRASRAGWRSASEFLRLREVDAVGLYFMSNGKHIAPIFLAVRLPTQDQNPLNVGSTVSDGRGTTGASLRLAASRLIAACCFPFVFFYNKRASVYERLVFFGIAWTGRRTHDV